MLTPTPNLFRLPIIVDPAGCLANTGPAHDSAGRTWVSQNQQPGSKMRERGQPGQGCLTIFHSWKSCMYRSKNQITPQNNSSHSLIPERATNVRRFNRIPYSAARATFDNVCRSLAKPHDRYQSETDLRQRIPDFSSWPIPEVDICRLPESAKTSQSNGQ